MNKRLRGIQLTQGHSPVPMRNKIRSSTPCESPWACDAASYLGYHITIVGKAVWWILRTPPQVLWLSVTHAVRTRWAASRWDYIHLLFAFKFIQMGK